MKKIFSFLLIFIILWSLFITSYATSEDKVADVSITASAYSVNIGESVNLSAISPKHGSSYVDSWSGAELNGTSQDIAGDYYISAATFKADKPGIYTIKYTITMNAGKSDEVFTGEAECTIEVIGEITVTGAAIRDLTVTEVPSPDGSISMYSASGNVYILWSNNTSTAYSSIYFFFGPNDISKDVSVTIYVSGIAYRFTLTVFRDPV